jgi:NTE family protein
MPVKNNLQQKQRALVLQGGGALGAYEAGVLSVLCEHLVDEDKGKSSNNKKEGPLFDIVAGTSMGAMNAAVLVSNVVNRKKTWIAAAKELENFWLDEAKEEEKVEAKKGGLSSAPDISKWWWDKARQENFKATTEAATRYYSIKEYLKHGTPNVYSAPKPEPDFEFGDAENIWFYHDSDLLQSTIERYSKNGSNQKLTIATSWEKEEPRLLVISVDVAKGETVAFDSYHTNAEEDPENSLYEGNGITIDHVMASGTIPIFYKFREIPKKGGRKFCDGGILSNTPFRELLQAHRDYWNGVIGENNDDDKIPDLDVYIINVHPAKQDNVPTDLDGVKDRINDISFMDRNSHYDEMVADLVTDYKEFVTDYKELIDKLKELVKEHFKNKDQSDSAFQDKCENILKTTEDKSRGAMVEDRKYKDLIKGRFKVTVTRIEPEGYEYSISGKGADFTSKTIEDLIEKGKQDARRKLKLQ